MTIKQYIKKNGWAFDCEVHPCRAMSVDIGFINGDGLNDETQFDIKAYDADELSDLFHDFCKENHCSERSVRYIVIVETADTMDDLIYGTSEEFKTGDIVFVSNPDLDYEREYGSREHRSFFGRVTEVSYFESGTVIEVAFPQTPNGAAMEWSYHASELSHANVLNDLTIDEFSKRYGVRVLAECIL
ncbi:MAG: hypothetical protein ACI4HI_18485 [Lachnospiraceae bacterium]